MESRLYNNFYEILEIWNWDYKQLNRLNAISFKELFVILPVKNVDKELNLCATVFFEE